MSAAEQNAAPSMLPAALWWARQNVPVFPLYWPVAGQCSCGEDCHSPAKHPLTAHGVDDASTDEKQITEWWGRWPHANIGLRTGVEFDAIDLDGKDAFTGWQQLKRDHGEPQHLAVAVSGREDGGTHFYCPPGGMRTVPSGKRGFPPGIEVKGVGGYVVAPPSIHISGRSYQFVKSYGTGELYGTVEWPAWYAAVTSPQQRTENRFRQPFMPTGGGDATSAYGRAVLRRAVSVIDTSQPGGRWNAVAREAIPLVARAVDGGCLDLNQAVAELEDAARRIGLTTSEIRRIRGLTAGMIDKGITDPIRPTGNEPPPTGQPFTTTEEARTEAWEPPVPLTWPVPSFPIHVLDWLADACLDTADRLQVPVDLVAMMTLATAAACVRGSARVHITDTWDEPLNLYICCVLGPGETKSPALAAITKPLRELEQRLQNAAKTFIADLEEKKDIARHRLEKTRKEARENPEMEPALRSARIDHDEITVPAKPLILAGDMTPEALVKLLAEQGGALAHISAEGSLLDTIVGGRYSGGAPQITDLLNAHDGREPIKVHRKRDDDIVVDDPCLTIGLAVQPQLLRALGDNEVAMRRGLAARFLYSVPASLVGRRETRIRRDASQTEGDFQCLVEGLEDLMLRTSGRGFADFADTIRRSARGTSVAQAQSFADFADIALRIGVFTTTTTESNHLLEQYRQHLEQRRHPDTGDLAGIVTWANKLDGQVLRLAAILQLIRAVKPETSPQNPQNPEQGITVSDDALSDALILADYLIDHATEAHVLMGAGGTRDLEPARQLLGWLKANTYTEFTVRDAHDKLRKRALFRESGDVQAACDELERRGWIWKVPHDFSKPGRPSVRYLVHPEANQ